MTKSQETMWHKQHKVIHNEVGQNGAGAAPAVPMKRGAPRKREKPRRALLA